MKEEGLSHLTKRARNRVERYRDMLKKIAGKNLVSLILYGNATLPHFDPTTGKLNFLIVLKEIDVDFLRNYARMMKRFRNTSSPLLLTPDMIKSSLDIFPIEFLSLKDSYIVIYGKDFLEGMDIRFEDLRYEIEQQIKRRLFNLQKEFLFSMERKADLEQLLTTSLISFVPLFKNILRLINIECPLEGTMFREFCDELHLKPEPFFAIWSIKTGRGRFTKEALIKLFGEFLKEIETLASSLDRVTPVNTCRHGKT